MYNDTGFRKALTDRSETKSPSLTPTEPAFPSLGAVVGGREVVLLLEERRSWSDALFFCRDFYGELLSIRSEEQQREVEELLSSAFFPLTAHVWVGLRR